MAQFEVRLKDPNSDEYRVSRFLNVRNADEAKAIAVAREHKKCAYQLPAAKLDLYDRKQAGEDVPDAPRRGEVTTHHQSVPFEIVSCKKVSGKPDKALIEEKEKRKQAAIERGGDVEHQKRMWKALGVTSVLTLWAASFGPLLLLRLALIAVVARLAITVNWFGLGLQKIMEQDYDLETATVKMALVTDSETPDRDADDFWNDASSNELASGNGYTTGGETLGAVAITYDTASDEVRVDCNDVPWTFTASKTWRYGYVYVDTAGASSTDPVIALLTWDSNQSISTSYTLTINAAGLLYLDTT